MDAYHVGPVDTCGNRRVMGLSPPPPQRSPLACLQGASGPSDGRVMAVPEQQPGSPRAAGTLAAIPADFQPPAVRGPAPGRRDLDLICALTRSYAARRAGLRNSLR